MSAPAYDVFISHAAEDKPGFVELLADGLRRSDVRVWYDDYVLRWGDSVAESIARGLADSRYGIVVLSRSFLHGGLPRHELRGLLQRQIYEGNPILPILHGVSMDELRKMDASLADLRALDTSRHDLDYILNATLHRVTGASANGNAPPPNPMDVHRLADLARLSRDEVLKRLERYGTAARLNPGTGEMVLGLGLTCLHLKRFPEAAEKLDLAVRLLPASGKAHLYQALALLRARPPRSLSLAEARQILQALETARSLDPGEALCDLFALIIKQEYFRINGLRVPLPDIAHHARAMAQKRFDREELAAFIDLLGPAGQKLLGALVR